MVVIPLSAISANWLCTSSDVVVTSAEVVLLFRFVIRLDFFFGFLVARVWRNPTVVVLDNCALYFLQGL